MLNFRNLFTSIASTNSRFRRNSAADLALPKMLWAWEIASISGVTTSFSMAKLGLKFFLS